MLKLTTTKYNNQIKTITRKIKPKLTVFKKEKDSFEKQEILCKTSNYFKFVHFQKQNKSLSLSNIENFQKLKNNSARGTTLSSKHNRKYLKELKKVGFKNVIDLREKYTSESYSKLCEENGLNYYNIPIDSSSVDDRQIIKNLPLLFKLLNKGNYYIACAQGLHRTDIALCINYVFNPKETNIPTLTGHLRDGKLVFSDIARRLNSIKKNITDDELKQLGWQDDFNKIYKKRKKDIIDFNTKKIAAG